AVRAGRGARSDRRRVGRCGPAHRRVRAALLPGDEHAARAAQCARPTPAPALEPHRDRRRPRDRAGQAGHRGHRAPARAGDTAPGPRGGRREAPARRPRPRGRRPRREPPHGAGHGDREPAAPGRAAPECDRIVAALDLAERLRLPVEWIPVSSGARIAIDSGTENLDATARVVRRIITFTEGGGVIHVIVYGVNVGAQSYWDALAT